MAAGARALLAVKPVPPACRAPSDGPGHNLTTTASPVTHGSREPARQSVAHAQAAAQPSVLQSPSHSPLTPTLRMPPAQQLGRGEGAERPWVRQPNLVTWAGCPAEEARPDRLTPAAAAAAAAGPLRTLSGEERGRACLRIGRQALMDSRPDPPLLAGPQAAQGWPAGRRRLSVRPLWPVWPSRVSSFGEVSQA